MTVVVNTQNKGPLNMRVEPKSTAKVLAQIPYKTSLEAEQFNDTWSKVTYNKQTGYVKTEYLSSGNAITKADLKKIYDSLKECLSTIEKIIK